MTTIRYYIHFIDCDGEASIIDHGFNNDKEAQAYGEESMDYMLSWTVQSRKELNSVQVDAEVLKRVLEQTEKVTQ